MTKLFELVFAESNSQVQLGWVNGPFSNALDVLVHRPKQKIVIVALPVVVVNARPEKDLRKKLQ